MRSSVQLRWLLSWICASRLCDCVRVGTLDARERRIDSPHADFSLSYSLGTMTCKEVPELDTRIKRSGPTPQRLTPMLAYMQSSSEVGANKMAGQPPLPADR